MALNHDKYQQVILYLCQQLQGELRGKKKLAKLLYFVDFDLFEKEQTSLTGDTYRALPMGPVPDSLEIILSEMEQQHLLSVNRVEEWDGYLPTETYKNLVVPDLHILTETEKNMVDRVLKKYGKLTGKQLEDLTHAEAPYVGTESRQEIPYELSFYRGTDFSEV